VSAITTVSYCINYIVLITISAGNDVFSCKKYFVSVQKNIVGQFTSEFVSSLAMVFACYSVFNQQYNPAAVAMLEFIQRWSSVFCVYW